MKILVTVHQFFPKYSSGTEVLAYETVKELQSRGHDVRVLCGEPVDYETAKKIQYYSDEYDGIVTYRVNHHLGTTPNPVRYEYANLDIQNIVLNIFDEFKPDVLHVMHCGRLGANMIDIAKEKKIPIVYTATDFWFICPISQLKLPDNSLCSGPNTNSTNCLKCYVSRSQPKEVLEKIEKIPKPILTMVNGIAKLPFADNFEMGKMVRALVRRKRYLLERINKIDKVIVPTNIMYKMMIENGVDNKIIEKLPYGLNTKYTKVDVKVKEKKQKITFGFIGTLYEHKGPHILIEAFQKLELKYSNIELKIYGDTSHFPDYFDYLKELTKNNVNIEFMGTFPNNDIGEVLEIIDVLVVPSIWYENTPLVIYSAFSMKTPVIASNLGGMSEVVLHEENGLLFEKGDIDDLYKQMEKVVVDNNLLTKLSTNILPVKTIKENVNEIEGIYSQLILKSMRS